MQILNSLLHDEHVHGRGRGRGDDANDDVLVPTVASYLCDSFHCGDEEVREEGRGCQIVRAPPHSLLTALSG